MLAVLARWRGGAGAHLEEVVCLKLLVRPLEEQLDGLLQIGAFRGGLTGHSVQGSPVQSPSRSLIPATHPFVLAIFQCHFSSGNQDLKYDKVVD